MNLSLKCICVLVQVFSKSSNHALKQADKNANSCALNMDLF